MDTEAANTTAPAGTGAGAGDSAAADALFLVACGESLALGHAAVCSALVLFHRAQAALASSGAQLDTQILAAACLLVVSKTSERPRMLRSVANAAHAHMNATLSPLGAGSRYRTLKAALINAEQSVLRALAFDVDAPPAAALLLGYARVFGFSRATAACALRLAGDALLDATAHELPAPVLAAATLRLASLLTEDAGAFASFSSSSPSSSASSASSASSFAERKWWYACDVSDEDVAAVAVILQRVHAFEAP